MVLNSLLLVCSITVASAVKYLGSIYGFPCNTWSGDEISLTLSSLMTSPILTFFSFACVTMKSFRDTWYGLRLISAIIDRGLFARTRNALAILQKNSKKNDAPRKTHMAEEAQQNEEEQGRFTEKFIGEHRQA